MRQAITPDARQTAALAAAALLQNHILFQSSHHIAAYLPRADEFDPTPIIQAIWHQHKNCYLPVLLADKKHLQFMKYDENDSLILNRYQILEPEVKEVIATNSLDLVLLPLVGFDLKGNRLGMGGGYYDCTFEDLLKQSKPKPFLLGLAYESQQKDALLCDEWDIPLQGVLTEKKLVILE